MSRYQGRNPLPTTSSGSNPSPMFSFAKQLVARRHGSQPVVKKIAPARPVLSSSKQKEAEINKILDKSFIPSGLRLAKIRQLAAQHKILGEKSRDFLHRSEAGHRLDTSDSIVKYEAELIEAASEATQDQVGHSPIKYKFRGDEHLREKGKVLYRKLQQEGIEKAREQAKEVHQANAITERRDRLAAMHAAINPAPTDAPARPPVAASHNMMPLMSVTPLPGGNAGTGSAGTLYATRSGASGDVLARGASSAVVPGTGVPGVAGHEHMGTPTITPPDAPLPTDQSAPTPPPVEVTLPSTDHLGDAFG